MNKREFGERLFLSDTNERTFSFTQSTPSAMALRFVESLPGVEIVLSGMSSLQQMAGFLWIAMMHAQYFK